MGPKLLPSTQTPTITHLPCLPRSIISCNLHLTFLLCNLIFLSCELAVSSSLLTPSLFSLLSLTLFPLLCSIYSGRIFLSMYFVLTGLAIDTECVGLVQNENAGLHIKNYEEFQDSDCKGKAICKAMCMCRLQAHEAGLCA